MQNIHNGKTTQQKFPKDGGSQTYTLFGIIHLDICGPFNAFIHYGCRYFITFTDDLSQYIIIYTYLNPNLKPLKN